MSTVPLSLTAQARAQIHNVCGDRRECPHGAVLHGGELIAAALASLSELHDEVAVASVLVARVARSSVVVLVPQSKCTAAAAVNGRACNSAHVSTRAAVGTLPHARARAHEHARTHA